MQKPEKWWHFYVCVPFLPVWIVGAGMWFFRAIILGYDLEEMRGNDAQK